MDQDDELIVGDRVKVALPNLEEMGTLKFIGKTRFSDGEWIGVALDTPKGKNNGTVNGVVYFNCEENYGLFLRRSSVSKIPERRLSRVLTPFQRRQRRIAKEKEERESRRNIDEQKDVETALSSKRGASARASPEELHAMTTAGLIKKAVHMGVDDTSLDAAMEGMKKGEVIQLIMRMQERAELEAMAKDVLIKKAVQMGVDSRDAARGTKADVIQAILGAKAPTEKTLLETSQKVMPTSVPAVVEDMFHKYDTNRDGWLRFEEFQNALSDEGVPSYMASIIFFMNDRNHDSRIDKNEFAATHEMVQKPLVLLQIQSDPTLQQLATQVVGEPHFLQELTFISSQTGGSHLGSFFQDTAGGKFYVKFPGISSVWNDDDRSRQIFNDLQAHPRKYYDGKSCGKVRNDKQSSKDKIQSKSEVLVSKLYGMVGVEGAFMRFVFVEGAEDDGPIGLWSRNMGYDDIGTHEMQGLKGLKEGFAADAWLANWDVIGNGSPAEMNMKRTKDGRAFRLDFGACLQYRATGGDKAETGCPFTADSVPEVDTLRRYNRVFNDVTDSDIAAGVAKIVVGATDSGIQEVVKATLGANSGNIADILIGRKNFLVKKFPPSSAALQYEESARETKTIPEAVDKIFGRYATDGEGSLDFDKFCKALQEEGVPSYMASIIFFMNDRNHDGLIDKHEFAATHEMVQKPLKSLQTQSEEHVFKQLATQVAGEPHFLQELTFISSQTGGSHLGSFFQDTAGGKFYVKFPGIKSVWNDDDRSRQIFEDIKAFPRKYYDGQSRGGMQNDKQSSKDKVQSRSEVLVSKLYGMVGVEGAFMRFVFVEGAEKDGPIGLWSRNMGYDDIGTHEMQGLKGLKEGFAADAWLANWDVIGNGSPAELNMKRTKDGRAFRLDFGACLQYRATGGDKAETGCPFTADSVPEVDTLRRYNRVFNDVTDSDVAAGVAKIVAGARDNAIRDVVKETLSSDAGNIAEILIGRKNFLVKKYPPPSTASELRCKELERELSDLQKGKRELEALLEKTRNEKERLDQELQRCKTESVSGQRQAARQLPNHEAKVVERREDIESF